MEKLSLIDLFSGIGGFSLGLERSGFFRTIAFCEIEEFPRRVLKKHWPDVPCHDDVTTREFVEGEADVVCGGFPCQDVSRAGKRAGLSGTRSGLYRELVRAICVVRPKIAIVENVAALISDGMGTVLGDLAEIGYDAEWHCIPASAVGAPHERDRVWIIANPRSEQHEGYRAPFSGPIAAELSRPYSDADGEGQSQSQGPLSYERRRPGDLGEKASPDKSPYANGDDEYGRSGDVQVGRLRGSVSNEGDIHVGGNQWASEPALGRVAYGVPDRAHRLKGLGNAVVPQIPELIGRAIGAAMFEASHA